MRPALLCTLALYLLPISSSTRIPLRRAPGRTSRPRLQSTPVYDRDVDERATGDGGAVDLKNIEDVIYIANVTVGGKDYVLQLDTGSSDLVVSSPVSHVAISSIPLNLTYGTGADSGAGGFIGNASVAFANQNVPNQALLVADTFNNPVTSFGAVGIMGLGFPSLSNIENAISKTGGNWGKTFLYNAFAQNTSEPNYITFSLTRAENGTLLDEGGFTIGELDSAYTDVMSTSPIPTWPVSNPTRWNILIDGYEVSDGAKTLTSSVSSVPNGKAVVLLDTGTAYVYAPSDLVTAMYGNVQGATYDSSAGHWVYLVINSGRRIDLHPLDLVVPVLGNKNKCIGSFIPQSLGESGQYDIVAGDVFLRNVYTVFDFGDYTDSSKLTMGDPYVKLLPTTNISQAILEFQNQRGGSSTLKVPSNPGTGSGSPTPSPSPTSTISLDDLARKVNHIESYGPALFAVLAVNAVIMLVVVIVGIMCLRRRGGRDRATGDTPDDGPQPKSGFLQNPFSSMGFRGLSRAGKRTKKRGRNGPANNTISTMELAPNNGDNTEGFSSNNPGFSYRPVSLQNPDAAYRGAPLSETYRMSTVSSGLRNPSISANLLPPSSPTTPGMDTETPMPGGGEDGLYDNPARYRHSTFSFRTEAYRDSAVL
ncbi:aspartic peptidase domain-containing protein [Cantharellus anzutake]|uniref:aspartic peptidase domain-containing protein n=1 Tax=Cantharellus anzutake TaxID=1750568 RepID=UPI0019071F26|nr:aspartic peptidase domain-containing protein [Cantharellus anzutake]KAF8338778.1 aspartic peptidase domain-containing protein [Cantharellus anzutake]